jgi:hypothetical protein
VSHIFDRLCIELLVVATNNAESIGFSTPGQVAERPFPTSSISPTLHVCGCGRGACPHELESTFKVN